ncbi:hypothetical protein PMAYCL1PPCAC_03320, partial [Pristionchus mayeri]
TGTIHFPAMKALLLFPIFLLGIQCDDVPIDRRINCYPDGEPTQEACLQRKCAFSFAEGPEGLPACYMRSDLIGYSAKTNKDGSTTLHKNQGPTSPWGQDIPVLRFQTNDVGNGVVNVRIDTEDKRYDPAPILDLPRETIPSEESLFVEVLGGDVSSFNVRREDNNKLFDTSIGGLIFNDQFIQIAALLPGEGAMYGWGENIHQNLKHDFSRYTTWGMFSNGNAPNSTGLHTANLYGVHPFYLLLEESGKAHGVFFLNSNAQEVTTMPAPALVYRTTGGFLDMYFFPGPTPGQVISQYHAFIGRPFMPSYWALGYQLCRWGYQSLDDLKSRVSAVMDAGIPLDIVYADIDYMDRRKDFTTGENWTGFNDYIDELHDMGMSSILIFDPAVQADYDVFQRAKDSGVSFVEWERHDQVQPEIQSQYPMAKDTKIMLGLVWPDRHVAFPDFLDTTNATDEWWEDEFKRYYKQVKFDGAWIDMNEPQVFQTRNTPLDTEPNNGRYPVVCPKTGPDAKYDSPPYASHNVWYYGEDAFLAKGTLCMNGMTQRGTNRMYNTHSLYGWSESRTTSAVMKKTTGKRSNVISRSTFASSGRYSGHWLGDNSATWDDLQTSISEAVEFNMFGIPYVGSDVCGFLDVSNEELCLRWHQMAAFHSFYRNHNAIGYPAQDPAVWPSVAAATKKANEFRYRYLPYLYHLHYRAAVAGEMVLRPLFFEHPQDDESINRESDQFMWGPAILVAPVYTPGVTKDWVYIPDKNYYSLYDQNYGQLVRSGLDQYDVPWTYNSPTFVRAGNIIPRHQSSALTTTALRKIPFSFLIVPSINGATSGSLFWDDGDSIIEDWKTAGYVLADISYIASSLHTLQLNVIRGSSTINVPSLIELEIFNYQVTPDFTSFTLNGSKLSVNTQASKYSKFTKILTIVFSQGVAVNKEGPVTIQWTNF